MREDVDVDDRLVLVWFVNDGCPHCADLEPEVTAFAKAEGAMLARTACGIVDPETGEIQVPALMYSHPKTAHHVFVGRFCLDALRYVLHG